MRTEQLIAMSDTLKVVKIVMSLLLILVFKTLAIGQNSRITDSLENLYNSKKLDGITEWNLLIDLAHYHPNLDEGLKYAQESLVLAKDMRLKTQTAYSYEEISEIYRRMGNLSKAMEASLEALRIYETEKDNLRQAAVFAQLGAHSVANEEYDVAIIFFNRALNLFESDTSNMLNRALTLINLGEAYRLNSKLDTAINTFKQALLISDGVKNKSNRIISSYAIGNLGMVYNSLDSLVKARDHLSHAIALTRQLGDPYTTSVYLADLGVVEHKEKNFTKAERNLLEAHELALKEGLKEQIRDISKLLVQLYESQDDFADALVYQKKYQQYQDSLINKENIQKVERIKANYEIDKRESEINLLGKINQQQKYLAIILGTTLVLFISLALIIYRTNKQLKQSNLTITTQKESLEKLNQTKNYLFSVVSHDLRSPINLLKKHQQKTIDLINIQDIDGAIKSSIHGLNTIESIAHLLTNVLNWALEQNDQLLFIPEYHPLEALVKAILEDYKLLATDKKITIVTLFPNQDLEVFLDKELFKISFRNLIDNAIKYTPANGEILIETFKEKETCCLTIQDNGPGITSDIMNHVNNYDLLDIEKINRSEGVGLGLLLSKTLILKNKGAFLLENKKHKGLKISLWLPTVETA